MQRAALGNGLVLLEQEHVSAVHQGIEQAFRVELEIGHLADGAAIQGQLIRCAGIHLIDLYGQVGRV